jgi:hypothetical protein
LRLHRFSHFIIQSYHFLLATLIGWYNERQQQIIEFQNDQIEALLENLGMKRLLLPDDQRRVLAVKGYRVVVGCAVSLLARRRPSVESTSTIEEPIHLDCCQQQLAKRKPLRACWSTSACGGESS